MKIKEDFFLIGDRTSNILFIYFFSICHNVFLENAIMCEKNTKWRSTHKKT